MNKKDRKLKEQMIKLIESDGGKRFKLVVDTEFKKGSTVCVSLTDQVKELSEDEVKSMIINGLTSAFNYVISGLKMSPVELIKILLKNNPDVQSVIVSQINNDKENEEIDKGVLN